MLSVLFRIGSFDTGGLVAARQQSDDGGTTVRIDSRGTDLDHIRLFSPNMRTVWIDGEKMSCRCEGAMRIVSMPILHNMEPCEGWLTSQPRPPKPLPAPAGTGRASAQ